MSDSTIKRQVMEFVEQNAPTDLSEILDAFPDIGDEAAAKNLLDSLVNAGKIQEEEETYSR